MIADRLLELRRRNKISRAALAEILVQRGTPSAPSTIARWESGELVPNANQFLTLCEIYDIEDIRQTFMGSAGVHDLMEGLNYNGKQEAKRYVKFLKESPFFSDDEGPRKRFSTIPFFALPASAGTGTFLHNDDCEQMEVDDTVPTDATMAIRLHGDSMTPRFADGQIVFVKEQPAIEIGQIGIFVLNGEGYCKRLGSNSLISLNSKYKPIFLRFFDEFRVVGKVVG